MVRAVRVLVVDDDPAICDSICDMLGAFGMQARSARSGREALRMCDRVCPFDVVLADVVMPDIGGVQLAEMLRDRYPAVPVILMTGRDSMIDGVIDAGTVPLFKPFASLQLKGVIDDALAD